MCRIAFSLLKLFKKRVDEMKKFIKNRTVKKTIALLLSVCLMFGIAPLSKKQHCGGLEPDRQRGIQ